MTTKYPAQLDTSAEIPPIKDQSSPVSTSSISAIRDAIFAIEQELGVKPSDVYSTVRARLDNIETILANVGNSNFVPTLPPAYNPAYLTQTDWYVDYINGDDYNNGSISSPVKTIMGGIVAKWGTESPQLSQSVTVHLVSSQPQGIEQVFLSPRMLGGVFSIIGTPLLSATITAGTVTAKSYGNPGTPLQVASMTGCTAGQLVHNVTHDSWAFIVKMSGTTAFMSQPLTKMRSGIDTVFLSFGGNTNPVKVDNWTTGDQLQVYNLPTINLVDTDLNGPKADTNYSSNAILWLENLHIVDASGTPGVSVWCPQYEGGYVNVSQCWIDPYVFTYTPAEYTINFVNCFLAGGGEGNSVSLVGGTLPTSNVGFALFGASYVDADFYVIDGSFLANWGLIYCGGFLLEGTASMTLHPASQIEIRQVYFSDVNGGVAWGAGSISMQPASTIVRRVPTTGFASCLYVTVEFPSHQTKGTAYNATTGVFTAGVVINGTNLDSHNGLFDPITGSRICLDLDTGLP